MNWLRKILKDNFFTRIIEKIKRERRYKKKLEEIKKRDPFIYK